MDCKTCIGCQAQESKDFKEVKQCLNYKSMFQDLRERKEEVYENIEKYRQIKI